MSAPVTRRRPGARRALSEDEVLDAAVTLLDGGPDAASTTRRRALAATATPAEHVPRSAAAAATRAGRTSTEQDLRGPRRVLDGSTARVAGSPERPVATP